MNTHKSLDYSHRENKSHVGDYYSANHTVHSYAGSQWPLHDNVSLANVCTSASSSLSTDSNSTLPTATSTSAAHTWLPPISSLLCHRNEGHPQAYYCPISDMQQSDFYYCYPTTFPNAHCTPNPKDIHINYSSNDYYSYPFDNVNDVRQSSDALYRRVIVEKQVDPPVTAATGALHISHRKYGVDSRPVKRCKTFRTPPEQQRRTGGSIPSIPFFFHHEHFGIEACMLQLDSQKQQQQQQF